MSGLKEIRRRISSVKNTKQITRAMKLVSAAKLRRAQEAATNGRAYSDRLREVISRTMPSLPDGFSNQLLEINEDSNIRRIVVVTGERGLCGAFNSNIVKAVESSEEAVKDEFEREYLLIGRRGIAAAKRGEWKTVATYEGLSENANEWPIDEIAEKLIKDFLAGSCHEVVLYYTKFISTMTQKVTSERLIPVGAIDSLEEGAQKSSIPKIASQIKFDPEPEKILAGLIPLLIHSRLRQAALESKAGEHAARMTAMDSATNNANELMDKLKLFYNRARQSAITKELLDIVGGAEAINQ